MQHKYHEILRLLQQGMYNGTFRAKYREYARSHIYRPIK